MPAIKHLKAQQVAGIMHVNRAAYEAAYILLLESLSPQYRSDSPRRYVYEVARNA